MVLTNLQRRELHAGIYEYLMSQGPAFEDAALALAEADPSCNISSTTTTIDENNTNDDISVSSRHSIRSTYSTGGLTVASTASSSLNRITNTPVLERKWTAVPRLQKKIFELEKIIKSTRRMGLGGSGSTPGGGSQKGIIGNGNGNGSEERRMLPRPPCNHELRGHSRVISCVAIHPTSTVAVSGSDDAMIKVRSLEICLKAKKTKMIFFAPLLFSSLTALPTSLPAFVVKSLSLTYPISVFTKP